MLPIAIDINPDCADNLLRESNDSGMPELPVERVDELQPPELQPIMPPLTLVETTPLREAEVLLTAKADTNNRPNHLYLEGFHSNYETPKRKASKKSSNTNDQRSRNNISPTKVLTIMQGSVKKEPDDSGQFINVDASFAESSSKQFTNTSTTLESNNGAAVSNLLANNIKSNANDSTPLATSVGTTKRKANANNKNVSANSDAAGRKSNATDTKRFDQNANGYYPQQLPPTTVVASPYIYDSFSTATYSTPPFVYAIDNSKQMALSLPPMSTLIAQQMTSPVTFIGGSPCGPGTFYHPSFRLPYSIYNMYQPPFATIPADYTTGIPLAAAYQFECPIVDEAYRAQNEQLVIQYAKQSDQGVADTMTTDIVQEPVASLPGQSSSSTSSVSMVNEPLKYAEMVCTELAGKSATENVVYEPREDTQAAGQNKLPPFSNFYQPATTNRNSRPNSVPITMQQQWQSDSIIEQYVDGEDFANTLLRRSESSGDGVKLYSPNVMTPDSNSAMTDSSTLELQNGVYMQNHALLLVISFLAYL